MVCVQVGVLKAASYRVTLCPQDIMSTHVSRASAAALLAAFAALARAAEPRPYPLFKQCDPRGGNDTIETTTICAVGCLMSSTAMALAGHNIGVEGRRADPGTLNAWLRGHGGYDSSNDFNEDALPPLDPRHIGWSDAGGMHRANDVPLGAIQLLLQGGQPVIANVMKGAHFVLVVGWDDATPDSECPAVLSWRSKRTTALTRHKPIPTHAALLVHDPGFERGNYSYVSDVVGWRLFNMSNTRRGIRGVSE